VPTAAEIIRGIRASGRYDATVGSEAEARRLLQQAMPDAVELPVGVAGQAYLNPPPGCRKWYQLHPRSQVWVTAGPISSMQTGRGARRAREAVGATLISKQGPPVHGLDTGG
jgi:hypothetical protein